MTLAAVPIFFQADRKPADTNAIRRDYNECRGLTVNPEPVGGADFYIMFDQDLLWTQSGGSVELPEKSLSATRALIKEVQCAVTFFGKGYEDLVQQLPDLFVNTFVITQRAGNLIFPYIP